MLPIGAVTARGQNVLDIGRIRALRGPNIWAECPVIELTLDPGEVPEHSPELLERLASWLSSLAERGAFLERMGQGANLADTLAQVALALQTLAGSIVSFQQTQPTRIAGQYLVACEYDEITVGLACVDSAQALLGAALHGGAFDVSGEIARLRALCQEVHLGPSTAAIAHAARARGIPVRRLGRDNLLLLGQGFHQRRVWTAETDRTGAIAEAIAQDKDLTRLLLRSVGVPVPEGRPVSSPSDAWAAAQSLGPPVVIKPRFGNHGRGISANLRTQEGVEQAFAAALAESPEILCERYVPGADHRLLVVGERVVAAALREPAQVIGDGVASVAELLDRANGDPRRSDGHATVLSLIKLDVIGLAVLAEQGYTPDSIPAAGTRVLVRNTANLSTGGTATDITDLVHPEVAARAVDAARVVGLDIAGVDVLTQDIGQPLEVQGGAVVEVNAGPGLRMHLEPSAGTPRPVGDAIVDLLFPPGQNGRIPVAAVTGGSGATAISGLIAGMLRRHGAHVGLTNGEGRFLAGRRVGDADCATPDATCAVFLNPQVEVAVLEVQPGEILEQGLGFDRCQVAVVAAAGGGQGEPQGDATPADLTQALRCLVGTVAAEGMAVLNAEDPLATALAGHCRGSVLWFARDAERPIIQRHRAQGGRAVVERDGIIVLANGQAEHRLLPLATVGPKAGNGSGLQVEEALAAAAAAWALGVPLSQIRAGLEDSDTR
jgi:cyanophycin synthetase